MTADETTAYRAENGKIICKGDWDLPHIPHLRASLAQIEQPPHGVITIDGSGIHKLDTAGAWLIIEWQEKLEQDGLKVELVHFSDEFRSLIEIVTKSIKQEPEKIPEPEELSWRQRVGKYAYEQVRELHEYLAFIGLLTFETFRVTANPKHIRWSAIADTIYKTGYLALPIIALLSFMIGVVLTYQMGLQLRNYGANVYIVDLLGLAVLREFGPLLTAIMVAGRTGSSFTAQLGMMKINQEIDALDTMGVTPAELLLLPRVAGLLIALPLLAMWSNIFGVLGGMVMANNMLNITWYDFLHRFPQVVKLKSLLIGLGKTPVFAFIIATIGCFEGTKVEGSAESVGRNTTRSVVLAIFFIIVADAIFSVIFSKLKL